MLTYIVPFLILILVVVFIHEYGHYYFARKYGVGVTDFSIGFGKELFGRNDKYGTRWKICAIPLGGYVKFFGDRNVYSQADHKEILEKYSKEEQEKWGVKVKAFVYRDTKYNDCKFTLHHNQKYHIRTQWGDSNKKGDNV